MSEQPTPPPSPAAPARSRKLLYFLVALLLVAGGGAGAYFAFAKPADATAAGEEEPTEPPAIVHFDPFVVNLADPGGARFLRLTIGVVVDGEDHAKEFAEDKVARMQTRSSIIEMLSLQHASTLVTAEGKTALKKAVIAHMSHAARDLKVRDVLFSEFIVQ
jgi:flagellar FliL protein